MGAWPCWMLTFVAAVLIYFPEVEQQISQMLLSALSSSHTKRRLSSATQASQPASL